AHAGRIRSGEVRKQEEQEISVEKQKPTLGVGWIFAFFGMNPHARLTYANKSRISQIKPANRKQIINIANKTKISQTNCGLLLHPQYKKHPRL
ncbi:MAG TPA: hypothetical protein VK947_13440, partial [Planococcus sp. (in: firmicutes)]|nr:hypothetical protein [Planococcus sp. (in: firmicutes)]